MSKEKSTTHQGLTCAKALPLHVLHPCPRVITWLKLAIKSKTRTWLAFLRSFPSIASRISTAHNFTPRDQRARIKTMAVFLRLDFAIEVNRFFFSSKTSRVSYHFFCYFELSNKFLYVKLIWTNSQCRTIKNIVQYQRSTYRDGEVGKKVGPNRLG